MSVGELELSISDLDEAARTTYRGIHLAMDMDDIGFQLMRLRAFPWRSFPIAFYENTDASGQATLRESVS